MSGPGLPSVYISGDNASLDRVHEIANRLGPFDLALLFVGAAQTALVAPAFLTLTSEQAVEAARILGGPAVIALHFEGWALREAFASAGLEPRLHILAGRVLHAERSRYPPLDEHRQRLSTGIYESNSRSFNASRSLTACSRPSRAR